MTMIITFMIFAIVSCIIMIIALTIRASKANPNEAIPRNEISFVGSMMIGCFVPGLNLLASICYLIRVIKK